GGFVALLPEKRECGASGDDRGEQADQALTLDETVVEGVRVGMQHGHAGERDRPADEAGCERAGSELLLERRFTEPGGGGAAKNGREVGGGRDGEDADQERGRDRKSTRLNSSHVAISDAVFCLKQKITNRAVSCGSPDVFITRATQPTSEPSPRVPNIWHCGRSSRTACSPSSPCHASLSPHH